MAIVIHGGWLILTAAFFRLPLAITIPLAGLLIAWHGSLQHEVVHGHPTRWPFLNTLIAGAPLSLWLPLPIYRESHLAHHRSELTHPIEDPESYYVTAAAWAEMGPVGRGLERLLSTLVGRLVLGPIVVIVRTHLAEAWAIRADRRRAAIWLGHLLACAGVLGWVVWVCGIPAWVYLLAFVYPGLAITLLRSFAEHRPDEDGARRTAVVEAGPLLSLIFLHNNLHALHHRHPGIAWYQLPSRYRVLRAQILAANGAHTFRGYGEIIRRFAFTPKDSPVHPGGPPW